MPAPSRITGSSVSVAAITAAGTSATSGGNSGGSGGAILLDATAGTITVGGNLTTTGGNGNGAGTGGNAGNITLNDAVVLTGNRVLSAVGGTGGTAGSGGNLQLLGTVDGNVAATRTLTLTGGTGDVTLAGAVGASYLALGPHDHRQRHQPGRHWQRNRRRQRRDQRYSGLGWRGYRVDSVRRHAAHDRHADLHRGGHHHDHRRGPANDQCHDHHRQCRWCWPATPRLTAGTGSAIFSSTVDLASYELVLAADEVDFAANVTGMRRDAGNPARYDRRTASRRWCRDGS